MTHQKQRILVPYESVARLHDTPTSSPQTQMNSLDTEMNYILQQTYADDSEKWKRYNETLQRYLHFANEARKPIPIEIKSVEDDSSQPVSMRQQLASVIPKTYKDQALKIHDYLTSTGSPVTWDRTGAVSIQGTVLRQSNIIDLISDLTRSRKNFEPEGVTDFVQALANMNIPMDLIGNEKRRTALVRARQTGGGIKRPPLRTPTTPLLTHQHVKSKDLFPHNTQKPKKNIHKIVSRNVAAHSTRWKPW